MAIAKLSILGNDYVGAFAIATDSFSIIGRASTHSEAEILNKNLETKTHRLSIGGSDLLGIYARGNSHALIVSGILYKDELAEIKKLLPDVKVTALDTDLNAIGNNVLANDKIAIINSSYTIKESKMIGDALDVEVIKMKIGGFETVGANNILTNKGIVMNNRVTDEEAEELKKLFGNVSQSTGNTGSLSIGLCAIANSKGLVVGKSTTGYEMSSMADGLMM